MLGMETLEKSRDVRSEAFKENVYAGSPQAPGMFVMELGKAVGRGVIEFIPVTIPSTMSIIPRAIVSPVKTAQDSYSGLVKRWSQNPPAFAGELIGTMIAGHTFSKVLGLGKTKKTDLKNLKGEEVFEIRGTEKAPSYKYVFQGVKDKIMYKLKGEVSFTSKKTLTGYSVSTIQKVTKSRFTTLLQNMKNKVIGSKTFYKDFTGKIDNAVKNIRLGGKDQGLVFSSGTQKATLTGTRYKVGFLEMLKSPKDFKTTITSKFSSLKGYRPDFKLYYDRFKTYAVKRFEKNVAITSGNTYAETTYTGAKTINIVKTKFSSISTYLKDLKSKALDGSGYKLSSSSMKNLKYILKAKKPKEWPITNKFIDQLKNTEIGKEFIPHSSGSVTSQITARTQTGVMAESIFQSFRLEFLEGVSTTTTQTFPLGSLSSLRVFSYNTPLREERTGYRGLPGQLPKLSQRQAQRQLSRQRFNSNLKNVTRQDLGQSQLTEARTGTISLMDIINLTDEKTGQMDKLELKQFTQQTTQPAPAVLPPFSLDFINDVSFFPYTEKKKSSFNPLKRKTKKKRRKGKKKRIFIEKTILADPLSRMFSKMEFGKATNPKPTLKVWREAEKKLFLDIPTKEQRRRRRK